MADLTPIIVDSRCRWNQIDRDSFGLICDRLSITELATTVHRINKVWATLLLKYVPSPAHPFRIDMRVPTSEDDDLEVMSPSLEANAFRQRQFWMCEDNLISLSQAAPIYRRLVTRLILDSSEHATNRCSPFPPAVVSTRLMRIISDLALFPNLSFLYARLRGFTANQHLEDGSIDVDDTWSLPRQLHTLDVVIEIKNLVSDHDPELQHVFHRIGSCPSLRRCSILLVGPGSSVHRYRSGYIQALTSLTHLFQLSLLPPINDAQLWPLFSPFKSMISLLGLWAAFPQTPDLLSQLFTASNIPVHQLKYVSSKNIATYLDDIMPYYQRFTSLVQLSGILSSPNLPQFVSLCTSLTRLTDLTLYLEVLDEMIRAALSQCIHLRHCQLFADDSGEVEHGENKEDYQALGIAFSHMKELQTIKLSIGRIIPEKLICLSPQLCKTLTSVDLGDEFVDTNVSLDLSPLIGFTSLTSIQIPTLFEVQNLTLVFDSLSSLRQINIVSHCWSTAEANQFLSALANSQVGGQLEKLGPTSLLAHIDPLKAAIVKKFVSLKQLIIRHLFVPNPHFLSHLKGLRSLFLGVCNHFIIIIEPSQTWHVLEENNGGAIELLVSTVCQLSQLTELGISELPELTSRHLTRLLKHLPSLTKLSLKNLKVTELSGLIERCANLTYLHLERLPFLAIDTMKHVSQLYRLQRLGIKDCPKMPLESYLFLCTLRSLRYLEDQHAREQILNLCLQAAAPTSTTTTNSSSTLSTHDSTRSSPLLALAPELCLLVSDSYLGTRLSRTHCDQLREECARRHPFWLPVFR